MSDKAITTAELRDGEPCKHPGCLSHYSHPCEGCGRIRGRRVSITPVECRELAGLLGICWHEQGESKK